MFPRQDGNKIVHKYPDFTVYTKRFKEVIDHIFYTKKHFDVVSLLELPSSDDCEDLLPNRHFPSDHLRIEAILSFK